MEQTWLEHEFNLQRQLLFFNDVIEYLQQLGFKLENRGCLDIHLSYVDNKSAVSVELGENEGLVMADVYESFTVNEHHSSTGWTESTVTYNSTDMIRRLKNSFHFSELK